MAAIAAHVSENGDIIFLGLEAIGTHRPIEFPRIVHVRYLRNAPSAPRRQVRQEETMELSSLALLASWRTWRESVTRLGSSGPLCASMMAASFRLRRPGRTAAVARRLGRRPRSIGRA